MIILLKWPQTRNIFVGSSARACAKRIHRSHPNFVIVHWKCSSMQNESILIRHKPNVCEAIQPACKGLPSWDFWHKPCSSQPKRLQDFLVQKYVLLVEGLTRNLLIKSTERRGLTTQVSSAVTNSACYFAGQKLRSLSRDRVEAKLATETSLRCVGVNLHRELWEM